MEGNVINITDFKTKKQTNIIKAYLDFGNGRKEYTLDQIAKFYNVNEFDLEKSVKKNFNNVMLGILDVISNKSKKETDDSVLKIQVEKENVLRVLNDQVKRNDTITVSRNSFLSIFLTTKDNEDNKEYNKHELQTIKSLLKIIENKQNEITKEEMISTIKTIGSKNTLNLLENSNQENYLTLDSNLSRSIIGLVTERKLNKETNQVLIKELLSRPKKIIMTKHK